MSGMTITTCLFIVDVQNGFITDKTNHIPGRIHELLEAKLFDHVIYSRFHNIPDSPYRRFLNWNRLSTPEEQAIAPQLSDFENIVFDKNGYTAVNNETLLFLDQNKIDAIFLAGIDTDGCVLATAFDFFQLNKKVYVLERYCASTGGAKSHEAGIVVLKRSIGKNNVIQDELTSERFNLLLSK